MREPVQLSLFEVPTFNTVRDQKEAMNIAAKNCGLSRDQIVDQMNDLGRRYGINLVKGNGSRLTLDTLEKWLNSADITRQMPMKALPVFCAVVGDVGPLDVLAKPLGAKVIGPGDQKLLRWAKTYHAVKKGRQALRQLESELPENFD